MRPRNGLFLIVLCALNACEFPIIINQYQTPRRLDVEKLIDLRRCYVIVAPPNPAAQPKSVLNAVDSVLNTVGDLMNGVTQIAEQVNGVGQILKGKTPSAQVISSPGVLEIPGEDPAWQIELAQRASKTISGAFLKVVALQSTPSQAPPFWIRKFSATSSLWLFPGDLLVRKTPKAVDAINADGNVTGKKTVWTLSEDWNARYVLFSEPNHQALLDVPYSISHSEADQDSEPDLGAYLSQERDFLVNQWLASIKEDLVPHSVSRERLILRGNTPKMKGAYSLAKKEDWDGAKSLWGEAENEDAANLTARYDLAVALERSGFWNEAREEYLKSRQDHGRAGKLSIEALTDLSHLMAATPMAVEAKDETSGQDFFLKPWILMPFSGDPDGATHAKALIEAGLRRIGYNLTSEQSSRDTNYAVYGNVEEYSQSSRHKDKRFIRLSLRLVEVATRKTVWEASEEAVDAEMAAEKLVSYIPHQR